MTTTSAPTRVEQLAEFVARADFDQLSVEAREQLKLRVLDSLGCALGALEGDPVKMIAAQNREFGGEPLSAQIAAGRTAPDRAALYNGALVRYLDFNDSYLAPGETCHPSDNLAPGLAYPATSFGATHAAFLAKRGITGPREVFEGNKGFMDAIVGDHFELDWSKEDLESVTRTILKKFNAEIHSQSAIEALIELKKE